MTSWPHGFVDDAVELDRELDLAGHAADGQVADDG